MASGKPPMSASTESRPRVAKRLWAMERNSPRASDRVSGHRTTHAPRRPPRTLASPQGCHQGHAGNASELGEELLGRQGVGLPWRLRAVERHHRWRLSQDRQHRPKWVRAATTGRPRTRANSATSVAALVAASQRTNQRRAPKRSATWRWCSVASARLVLPIPGGPSTRVGNGGSWSDWRLLSVTPSPSSRRPWTGQAVVAPGNLGRGAAEGKAGAVTARTTLGGQRRAGA